MLKPFHRLAIGQKRALLELHAPLTFAAAKVGATALVEGGKDAAILITLPPGIYTAQMSGTGGSTGIGLIEVYEVP